jgi:hypothetical protein
LDSLDSEVAGLFVRVTGEKECGFFPFASIGTLYGKEFDMPPMVIIVDTTLGPTKAYSVHFAEDSDISVISF